MKKPYLSFSQPTKTQFTKKNLPKPKCRITELSQEPFSTETNKSSQLSPIQIKEHKHPCGVWIEIEKRVPCSIGLRNRWGLRRGSSGGRKGRIKFRGFDKSKCLGKRLGRCKERGWCRFRLWAFNNFLVRRYRNDDLLLLCLCFCVSLSVFVFLHLFDFGLFKPHALPLFCRSARSIHDTSPLF